MSPPSDRSVLGQSSATPGRRFYRRKLPRRAGFWSLAGVFCLLFVSTSAPSPLYRVYQAEWHFSATTLTAVFAVFVLVLLLTLLMFGSVSDYFGRRRTIVAGLAAYGMGCGVFLVAGGVAALFVARALQGVAVGLATGALGASLLELQPEGSGGFGASALVQYGPARTHLVWWLLLGAGVVAVVAVLAMPESRAARSEMPLSFRPRLRVPRGARGAFVLALPCLLAGFALGGFYLSLGPSLAAQLLRSQNLLWGGVVIALLFGVGVPVILAVRKSSSSNVILGGCVALLAGAAITFVAIATWTSAVLLAGTAVAGLGWGPAFMGAYGSTVPLARPDDRAGLVAAVFTVGYLAFSIPAVIAGVATSHYGLHNTALVYSPAVAVLAATAAGGLLLGRSRTAHDAPLTTPHRDQRPEPSTTRRTPAELCRQNKAETGKGCEVSRLLLEDLDWRAGEVIVRGKRDYHERLPLPVDVGDALVDYLRQVRPRSADRHVFLTSVRPHVPLNEASRIVGQIVLRASKRAGLGPVGVHRLRHTVATEALRAGAPLEEIASLLRHRDYVTTIGYAKIDWVRLRELARPWPGVLA
jgi:hypothetical protein